MQKMTNQELAEKIADVAQCVLHVRKAFDITEQQGVTWLSALESRLGEATQALERGSLVSPVTVDALADFANFASQIPPRFHLGTSGAAMSGAQELGVTIAAIAENLRARNRSLALDANALPRSH